MVLRFPPISSMCVDQIPEGRAVIVVLQVRQFMSEHIVDALPWCFDKVAVDDDLAGHGSASPLA